MFQGSIVAMITPMLETGVIDDEGLEALVAFHIENGTDAIVAMGTTGESATLSHKEHRYVVKQVVKHVNGRIPVIAGTGSNSTQEALELTKAAKEDGADACLLVTPYYNKPTQEGLYLHHKTIADEVAIPQILYNVPGRTACDMLPETVKRLSTMSNIVGIKEATGDIPRAQQIMDLCGDAVDVYSGDDATAMALILAGGKANISVTANVAPRKVHDLCMAALKGDRDTAERINSELMRLNSSLFLEANPIPVKWVMSRLGFGSDAIRLPLTTLSEPYQETVIEAAQHAGVDVSV